MRSQVGRRRRRDIGAAWVSFAVLAFTAPAGAESFLIMRSQPGDYIGQGESYYFTASDTAFSIDARFGGVVVQAQPPSGTSWVLLFAAPAETPLAPGPYEDATRAPFQSPARPGLSVSGDGRGCNQAIGRFVVLESGSAPDGSASFSADFEQHCEGGAAALFGTIAVNSFLQLPPPPSPTPTPDPATSYLLLDSDPNNYIGQGLRQQLSNANGTFVVVHAFGYLLASFRTPHFDFWTVELAAPEGEELRPGVYTGAARFPFEDPEQPGLDASAPGRGCNMVSGTFVIHSVDYGPGNEVASLAADFEHHCEGGPNALRGAIRVNETLPPGACNGDCDGNRVVSVDELLTGVNVLLGRLAPEACPALDLDGTDTIGIDAVVRAVNAAQVGCIGPSPE